MKIIKLESVFFIFCFIFAFLAVASAENNHSLYFEYELNGKHVKHEYVLGTRLYPQPDMSKPRKGIPYFDPVFGTKITRISDPQIDGLGSWAKKGYGSLMHPGYPKHNYDNADGSVILLYGSYKSGKVLYNSKTLKLIKSLSPSAVNWNQPVEPRWDAHDPDKLYYHHGSVALSVYNIRTDKFKVVHDFKQDFPGSKGISMQEEGNCSYDSRYFAFLLRAPRKGDRWAHAAVFCYDRIEDRIVGKIDLPIPGFEGQGGGNWVGMSPSGKYVLLGTTPMLVYDREFQRPPVKLTHKGGWHCSVGLDDEGREVIFYVGSRKFSPGGQSNGCYAMCDLKTGTETVLSARIGRPHGKKSNDWHYFDWHIDSSCIFTPGWGLVSVHHPDPVKQTHWTEYSIHLVELTRRKNPPPRIWRICHTHVNKESYTDSPFATFDRFGKKIFFGSNWGTPLKKGGDIDAYQVELPLSWYEDLMGKEKAARLRKIAAEMVRKKW